MAQKPLSPNGGKAEVFSARFPSEEAVIIHEAMQRLGGLKSECLRRLVLRGLEAEGVLNAGGHARAS